MDASAAQVPLDAPDLTPLEIDILTFEKRIWRRAGAKEDAVRETFQLSITSYYQVLNALIDRPEALAYDPLLVRRLQRLRGTRRRGVARGAHVSYG